MPQTQTPFLCLFLLNLAFLPDISRAAGFPQVADAEKSLTAVAGQPNAPGVVLYRKGQLYFRDFPREANSRMEIQVRLKILTEEGKKLGEVELAHNPRLRLENFEGRIVRPDGSEQDLPKEAIFVERRSTRRKALVTRAAFPNVEVGAIIDYRYTYYWDDFYYLEPWYFNDDLPVLHSEVLYEVPPSLSVQVWSKETSAAKIQTEKQQLRDAWHFRAWMDNLPGLPNESLSFPNEDLSSRYLLIPLRLHFSNERTRPLLESWKEVSNSFWVYSYDSFLDKVAKAATTANQLAAGKDRRGQIRALYEFVRDQVRTGGSMNVWVRESTNADEVLTQREGSASEKTLLLYAMLEAIKVPARVVWVASRNEGRAEFEVPNPAWFDGIVLQVDDSGQTLSLDPSDRGLGFGHLPPYYESIRAIVVDRKTPESIILPAAPYSDNSQKAVLSLTVDVEGKMSGQGELSLAGHPARRWLRSQESPEKTAQLWLEKLTQLFPDFEPSAVVVTEDLHDQQLKVGFKLAQRPEKVLGDEVSLQPAVPFLANQPLLLPPERRRTPVLLPFAGLEETRLRITWQEGFEVESLPKEVHLETAVGAYSLSLKTDRAMRSAEVVRHFSRHQHEIHGRENYATLRNLYEKATQSDAQTLVLVRP